MIAVYVILGFVIGFIIAALIYGNKSPKEDLSGRRRGLYMSTLTSGNVDKKTFNITCEVIELECADDMSKIKCTSIQTDQSEFNTAGSREKIRPLVEGWRKSSNIKWFDSTVANRNKKLDDILS